MIGNFLSWQWLTQMNLATRYLHLYTYLSTWFIFLLNVLSQNQMLYKTEWIKVWNQITTCTLLTYVIVKLKCVQFKKYNFDVTCIFSCSIQEIIQFTIKRVVNTVWWKTNFKSITMTLAIIFSRKLSIIEMNNTRNWMDGDQNVHTSYHLS